MGIGECDREVERESGVLSSLLALSVRLSASVSSEARGASVLERLSLRRDRCGDAVGSDGLGRERLAAMLDFRRFNGLELPTEVPSSWDDDPGSAACLEAGECVADELR